ncbi:hypothetical protein GCM10007205_03950 [Oxalicibacterium flavum]|uniref:DUF4282 domain-containing protein n=1 Tax=Oxalicibacterium flavum TaxID=179467 RepID=A0A8J2XYG9_9BURK|nr:DUF4282 domain-containing protein [Oxalicibacterium flavum]GGB97871.1 hypothetical protein GCM10007205_03950 [Oxalicibacterium flavum]
MQTNSFAHSTFRYLNLDHLIAPFLIKAIYWLGIVVILSAGFGSLFAGQDGGPRIGVPLTVIGVLLTLLLWRLFSELLILAFNLHARLTEIRDLLTLRQTRVESHRKAANAPSLKSPRLNSQGKVQHD